MKMSRSHADVQWPLPASSLPAARVLDSGAVIFPGAFDQHGCPLVIFPVETQGKLSEISREEVSHFIHYCLRLHKCSSKRGEQGLVSVVADLREADVTITRFIAETLEFCRRVVHTVYIVQPQKKSVQKQLRKLLTAGSKQGRQTLFRQVFLKDVSEIYNYIDRSQLTVSLGGHLTYSHESWVALVREIDAFVQEFLSVVSRLPLCISTLHSFTQLHVPSDYGQLLEFYSVNEARFQRLRRDLGLDALLKHCECFLEKLRFPETDQCFHLMTGTVLFSHASLEMRHNYNRIKAAVEKVELLWQQAFSKARLQLHVTHLQREAQQIQEQMVELHRQKVQPCRVQIATDPHRAEVLRLEFESSIYTNAMVLVRRAEHIIHMLAKTIPGIQSRVLWMDDLQRIKENLRSSVQHIYQTLRNVSDFHYTCNRCKNWYNLVLCKTFLQDLLRGSSSDLPNWRQGVEMFLRRNPCPEVQELVKLAHLSTIITDPHLQNMGRQLSHRCIVLRRLLTSAETVPIHDLQHALQWQYEYLADNKPFNTISPEADHSTATLRDSGFVSSSLPQIRPMSQCESLYGLAKWPSVENYHQVSTSAPMSAAGKPQSVSSFDSGFDGAGCSHLDTRSRRKGLLRFQDNRDSFKSKPHYAQINEENIVSVSDSEDQHEEVELNLKRDATLASIQIAPKITSDFLNLEIRVKRSTMLPKNPWLSLPIDDLESSYTVTITQNLSNQQRTLNDPSISNDSHHIDGSKEELMQTRSLRCVSSEETKSSILQGQESFEDSDLNSIDILSSTITDNEGKLGNIAKGEASLLWDTFDLHNLRQDSFEQLDASVSDWVQGEQQELEEVKKTLDRAAEILEVEENVLAQEVILSGLLETEDLHKHWPFWTEDQHSVASRPSDLRTNMIPEGLVKSGVTGGDYASSSLLVIPQSHISEEGSSDFESFKACEVCKESSDSPGLVTEDLGPVGGVMAQNVDRNNDLKEHRDLHVIKEHIEESLKPGVLLCNDADEFLSEPTAQSHVTTCSSCIQRRLSLMQLQEEQQKVEDMERSLKSEPVNVKRRSGLVTGQQNFVSATEESSPQKPQCKKSTLYPTEVYTSPAPLKQAAKEDSSLKVSFNSESLRSSVISRSDLHTSLEVDWTNYPAALDSVTQSKHDLVVQPCQAESVTYYSLSHKLSTDLPALVHSKRSQKLPLEEIFFAEVSSNQRTSHGQVSLSQETSHEHVSPAKKTNHEQGAFDPGGVLAPVPTPRSAFCFNNKRTLFFSEKRLSAADRQGQSDPVINSPVQIPSECTNPLQSKSQRWQMQNNNNNKNNLEPALHTGCCEPEESSASFTIMLKREMKMEFKESVSVDEAEVCSEVSGRFPGHERNECGLPDGGSTRAVCRSSLNQLQLNTTQHDYNTPIVLDTGSGLIKAGFADQDLPATVFPTVIGHPKYEEVISSGVARELYVGHSAQHMRGVLTLKYPMRNGIIHNWDEIELIWCHAFQQLSVNSEDHPVLLSEAAMNPLENRKRMIELMFETFNVPLTFVAMQAVLALYASGRTTGVVLDSGDGVSHSVPVFDGYCLPHAVQSFGLAGSDVTVQLQKLLLEQGVCMQTSAELEIVREMKEKCCCVALNYDGELQSSSSEVQYTLPDGHLLSLTTERFRAPEILFKPELIGRDHYGMHECVFKSILQSDMDLRRNLVENIILSGGNTLLSGLPERLQQEVGDMVPVDLMDCVRVTSPRDRDFLVWCGGAMLANLPTFTSAWIRADEYEEFGPQIVFRKCF